MIEWVITGMVVAAGSGTVYYIGKQANHYRQIAEKLVLEKTMAEQALKFSQENETGLKLQLGQLEQEKTRSTARIHEIEKQNGLLQQQLEEHLKQVAIWKQDREQYLEMTRASIMKVGSEVSSKLLDDHKRETEIFRKENQTQLEQTTHKLHQEYKQVFEAMHHLTQKVGKAELIERALLSPQGAGALAEITLENIFKVSGLTADRDYILQHWVEKQNGTGVRPDAVVFLPDNHVLVIDSKASKFYVEREQCEGEAELQKNKDTSLKQTMQMHLKSLTSRDYQQAVFEQMEKKQAAIPQKNLHVTVLMFLPTEAAVERLRAIDPGFEEKAWQSHIIPVGPAGLVNALLQSRMVIANARQDENTQKIIGEVKKLLLSVAKMCDLSEALGRSIKSTVDKYDRFAASFNSNFLPKARRVKEYGVLPENQPLPKLNRYQLTASTEVIEANALETEEVELITS